MALPPKLQETLDLLAMMPDRQDRIDALISISKRFDPVSGEVAERPFEESHRVPACESEAFAWVTGSADAMTPHYAVENPQGISAMALAVILQDALTGRPTADAQQIPDEVIYEIFGKELSMGKSAGLMGMVQLTKTLAARL